MNILYISQMNNVGWTGPTHSVPRQIAAQAKYDNVFWYHLRDDVRSEWTEHYYVNSIVNYPQCKIRALPEPFNTPDLVIIEQFYGYAKLPVRKELIKSGIPYIIIPRGELTKKAQQRRKLKKQFGNLFIFNKFTKRARAIQYLTEQERITSGSKWNSECIVIPNGTDKKEIVKTDFNKVRFICTSIGRIESYQKGIDLLITACGEIKSELINANCEIHLYGPDQENQKATLYQKIKDADLSSIIYIHVGVFGEDKKKILLDSDVFIMTSRFEGHPMALIEAMSYGIPCFATVGTNMAKEISESNSGWTADTSVESIRDSMRIMIKERDQLVFKGKNALELSSKYNWDIIAEQSHLIYQSLLSLKNK